MAAASMPARLYIPECYVDEISPPGRAHPSDWIGASAGDVYLLEGNEEAEFDVTIAPGQVIPFMWNEDLGSVDVEIREDSSRILYGDDDPKGNAYWLAGDADTWADSLDGFIAGIRDNGIDVDSPVTVEVARWSETSEQWRLEVSPEGPRFVRINETSAQPGGEKP